MSYRADPDLLQLLIDRLTGIEKQLAVISDYIAQANPQIVTAADRERNRLLREEINLR